MTQRTALETYHIACDDLWHRIDVNGRTLTLSPTHYRIFRVLLSPSISVDVSGEMVIIAYRSRSELETKTALSHHMLIKHISDLNARCAAMGLSICAYRTGYLLIATSGAEQEA